jgi:hypothetical protein
MDDEITISGLSRGESQPQALKRDLLTSSVARVNSCPSHFVAGCYVLQSFQEYNVVSEKGATGTVTTGRVRLEEHDLKGATGKGNREGHDLVVPQTDWLQSLGFAVCTLWHRVSRELL